MKKYAFILILLAFACGKDEDPKDPMVGTWKYTTPTTDVTAIFSLVKNNGAYSITNASVLLAGGSSQVSDVTLGSFTEFKSLSNVKLQGKVSSNAAFTLTLFACNVVDDKSMNVPTADFLLLASLTHLSNGTLTKQP